MSDVAITRTVAPPTVNVPTAPLRAGGSVRAIVPQTMEEAYRLAQAVHKARMNPKGLESPEACMIAILHGLEIGLTPMMALQRIAVVNGRPTLWGDGALALVRSSGLCESISESIEGEDNDRTAWCETKRKGETEVSRSFSVADAKKAGLWGKTGPWSHYPDRMLQMRARAFALRDVYADVLGGMYLHEEIDDTTVGDAPFPAIPSPPKETEVDSTLALAATPKVIDAEVVDKRPAGQSRKLHPAPAAKREPVPEPVPQPSPEAAGAGPLSDVEAGGEVGDTTWSEERIGRLLSNLRADLRVGTDVATIDDIADSIFTLDENADMPPSVELLFEAEVDKRKAEILALAKSEVPKTTNVEEARPQPIPPHGTPQSPAVNSNIPGPYHASPAGNVPPTEEDGVAHLRTLKTAAELDGHWNGYIAPWEGKMDAATFEALRMTYEARKRLAKTATVKK